MSLAAAGQTSEERFCGRMTVLSLDGWLCSSGGDRGWLDPQTHIYLRQTEQGWVLEARDGAGLVVPTLRTAITLADQWIRAAGGSGIVVTYIDGTTEIHEDSDD